MRTTEKFAPYGALVGRVLLAAIFLIGGIEKIPGWSQTAGYMASKGMPLVPLFLAAAIALEILGGLSIVLGLGARWTGAVLSLYLIPVTAIFHPFWSDPSMTIHFLKNLAIMGGMLSLAASGPGAISLDAYLERRKPSEGPRGRILGGGGAFGAGGRGEAAAGPEEKLAA